MYKIIKAFSRIVFIIFFLLLTSCVEKSHNEVISYTQIEFSPETYVCYRVHSDMNIDGIIDSEEWRSIPWTNYFVDIEGDKKPEPLQKTRVKILWDEKYLYIAAELEETDIWAKLTERESVIFMDNNFEVFIDPSNDTHKYYELEINALGTLWDLMLIKPYRDGGPALNAWDIRGLKSAVHIDGTINDPTDVDNKWTVELAIPFKVLKECAPGRNLPKAGDQWRFNFSRVEWLVNAENGSYIKKKDSVTGKRLPEFNWVWTSQEAINLHIPEMWGFVQFSEKKAGQGRDNFIFVQDEKIKWALRQIYYQEKVYRSITGQYTNDLKLLGLDDYKIEGIDYNPEIELVENYYLASAKGITGEFRWFIRPDGFVWKVAGAR